MSPRPWVRSLPAALLAALLLPLPAANVAADPSLAADEVVVLYAGAAPADPQAALGDLGLIDHVVAGIGVVTLKVDPAEAASVIAQARTRPGVVDAYQGRLYGADLVLKPPRNPNDVSYPQQWGPPVIGMPQAWGYTLGYHTVTVAVLDTGTDYFHPDLWNNTAASDLSCGPDRRTVSGSLFNPTFAPFLSTLDGNGHGTHVAGTVAAVTNNVLGVAGMSQSCIMTVKVLGDDGRGSSGSVVAGIAHAAANGADVISMSLGTTYNDPAMARAVQDAWAAGSLIVASAGNRGCPASGSSVGFPGAYPEVVAVAALSSATTAASFSSCGPEVDVAAPGESILSTYSVWRHFANFVECVETGMCEAQPVDEIPGVPFYAYLSGTSMAAPHVSGSIALAKERNPDLTNAQLRCLIEATADDLGAPGVDRVFGRGRIDAGHFVQIAETPALVGC